MYLGNQFLKKTQGCLAILLLKLYLILEHLVVFFAPFFSFLIEMLFKPEGQPVESSLVSQISRKLHKYDFALRLFFCFCC